MLFKDTRILERFRSALKPDTLTQVPRFWFVGAVASQWLGVMAHGRRNILHPGRREYLAGLFIQLMYTGKISHPDNTLHHRQPVAQPLLRESP